MISDLKKWQPLRTRGHQGYSLIDVTTAVLVIFTMGGLSYSLVHNLRKKAHFSGSTPLAGLPVSVSENSTTGSEDWKVSRRANTDTFMDEVPVSLNPIEPEIAYSGEPKDLDYPTLSHFPGSYMDSDFPLNLNISNPNDPSTWIMLSINGGQFNQHVGGGILINSGDRIEAYVRGDTREWNESVSVGGVFTSKSSGIKRPGLIPVRRIKMQPY